MKRTVRLAFRFAEALMMFPIILLVLAQFALAWPVLWLYAWAHENPSQLWHLREDRAQFFAVLLFWRNV